MFCIFIDDVFTECTGNVAFSESVFQPAETLTNEQRLEFSVYEVFDEFPQLEKDHRYVQEFSYRIEDGCVIRTWAQEEISSDEQASTLAAKVDTLWRAADAYQSAQICGAAIGLLTIAVLQQKQKALAVQAWITSIWDEYYRRKALLTYDAVPDVDFSMFGTMPYSIPELREELGM